MFRSMVFICWVLSLFCTDAFGVNISSCHLKSYALYVLLLLLLAFEFIGLCRCFSVSLFRGLLWLCFISVILQQNEEPENEKKNKEINRR